MKLSREVKQYLASVFIAMSITLMGHGFQHSSMTQVGLAFGLLWTPVVCGWITL